ncbi:unnamed protein product [Pleuronectes platessa]|uniref:Uncharacterized protein n=1 Tax=Pleuronectes platessa TaxID=8262 RepID=A0A9N7ZEQ5_PLEPL|nr:unnamed protein product [Pleuronectes platessa]
MTTSPLTSLSAPPWLLTFKREAVVSIPSALDTPVMAMFDEAEGGQSRQMGKRDSVAFYLTTWLREGAERTSKIRKRELVFTHAQHSGRFSAQTSSQSQNKSPASFRRKVEQSGAAGRGRKLYTRGPAGESLQKLSCTFAFTHAPPPPEKCGESREFSARGNAAYDHHQLL